MQLAKQIMTTSLELICSLKNSQFYHHFRTSPEEGPFPHSLPVIDPFIKIAGAGRIVKPARGNLSTEPAETNLCRFLRGKAKSNE